MVYSSCFHDTDNYLNLFFGSALSFIAFLNFCNLFNPILQVSLMIDYNNTHRGKSIQIINHATEMSARVTEMKYLGDKMF